MKVAVYDTHRFDREALEFANNSRHELCFLEMRFTEMTAILAQGCDAVCLFVNDRADAGALKILKDIKVKLILLRSAGYNHVDIKTALQLEISVVNVPSYSPHAVAEFAVGLLLSLNRKIHKAHNRVHDMNFSLEGLVGFDVYGKTVGVIGTGRIGKNFCQIMRGFGCRVLAADTYPDRQWATKNKVSYVDRSVLFSESDILSLHTPLTSETRHIINPSSMALMKKNIILINTGRGALIDTHALIKALKAHLISGACLDVYEEEGGIFFNDLSESGIADDDLARLLTFPNVLVTSHQGFLTHEALNDIARTTIESLTLFEAGGDLNKVIVTI